jgi:hypothetical protein
MDIGANAIGFTRRDPTGPTEPSASVKPGGSRMTLGQLDHHVPFEVAGRKSVKRFGQDAKARAIRQQSLEGMDRIGPHHHPEGIGGNAHASPSEHAGAEPAMLHAKSALVFRCDIAPARLIFPNRHGLAEEMAEPVFDPTRAAARSK